MPFCAMAQRSPLLWLTCMARICRAGADLPQMGFEVFASAPDSAAVALDRLIHNLTTEARGPRSSPAWPLANPCCADGHGVAPNRRSHGRAQGRARAESAAPRRDALRSASDGITRARTGTGCTWCECIACRRAADIAGTRDGAECCGSHGALALRVDGCKGSVDYRAGRCCLHAALRRLFRASSIRTTGCA